MTAHPHTSLKPGTFRAFTGANGMTLEYHLFDNGGNGTLFYFDGDETQDFHEPLIDATVRYEPGKGNGHAQRLNAVAAQHGVDLVFIEHPGGADGNESWWEGADFVQAAQVVRELVDASGAENALFLGYSGGSEFLISYLMIGGNAWAPENTALAMVGGGGILNARPVAPAEGRAGMRFTWIVGEHDVVGATTPVDWSAFDASTEAQAVFAALGYTAATVQVVPCTAHLDYDFTHIVDEQLELLLTSH